MEAVSGRLGGEKKPTLALQPSFRKVMDQLPQNRSGEVYLDPGWIRGLLDTGALEPVFQGKKSKRKNSGGMLLLDPAHIPSQKLWTEYFGPIGAATSHRDDLFRLQAFILYP
jgi:hypothetical protein